MALGVLLAIAAAVLLVACESPPQVLEISPQRGASDVRSNQPIRVRFDRPMDQASVASRFHVEPRVTGTLSWTAAGELTFDHAPLNPTTQYRVVLDAGYRDARGSTNGLRHSWTFQTEGPPVLAGSSPGAGDRGVDPAAFLALDFNRAMDPDGLAGAITLSPATPLVVHQDEADPRRVTLAPQELLAPRTPYTVTVAGGARDVDGNRLSSPVTVAFTTGDFQPLKHWVGFIAGTAPGTVGSGVWVVNENRLPRRLVSTPVTAFTWSGDGSHLLLRGPTGAWVDQPLDGAPTELPFTGEWADFLAPGHGYVFLNQGRLQVLRPDGGVVPVATGVTSVAVAPGGERLAFVTRDPTRTDRASEISGYDTTLRTRYRLQSEPDTVDGLAWSPDGQSLAYRLLSAEPARQQVRVRSLRDGGTVTVAVGEISPPAWQADRQHVFFTASLPTATGPVTRAFRFSVSDGSPHALSVAAGLPGVPDLPSQTLSPSPDGHQLAFLADVGGRSAVWTMNADGTGVTQLTDSDPVRFPYSSRDVAWTPS